MRYPPFCTLLPIIQLFRASVVEGSGPYFIISSTRPKCFTVLAPRGTTLSVQYDAPDMVIMPADDAMKSEGDTEKERYEMGLDSRYNKRFREKMAAMQHSGQIMKDMSITIQPRGDVANSGAGRGKDVGWGGNKLEGRVPASRLRQDLLERQGSIEYETGSWDGEIEICIQSLSAAQKAPSRVSLRVDQQITSSAKRKRLQESQETAKKHLSKMERDLIALTEKVAVVLANADFSKDQEVQFHDQSLALNRSSQWWPILHIIIILVAGVMQANHMVRFFKSRHIY